MVFSVFILFLFAFFVSFHRRTEVRLSVGNEKFCTKLDWPLIGNVKIQ